MGSQAGRKSTLCLLGLGHDVRVQGYECATEAASVPILQTDIIRRSLTGILFISGSAWTAARVPTVAHATSSHEAIALLGSRMLKEMSSYKK